MAAPGQSRVPRPGRGFARLAASLILLFTLFVILKRGQLPRASSLVQVPAAAELTSALSTGGTQPAEQQAKQEAVDQASTRARADGSGGGGGGSAAGARTGDIGESPAQPDKAEHTAGNAASQAAPAAQPAAQAETPGAQPAAAAAAAAAPSGAGGQPQLEQVAKVDIGAKADVYLGFQILLRAQVTPFRKCKVTQYQPKPMNDAQASWRAHVYIVLCLLAAACVSRRALHLFPPV